MAHIAEGDLVTNSSEQGLVSILSPVYNEAAHIAEMIRSVQAQTYANWELLFADDGSTDDTLTECRRWARDDERIKVVHGSVHIGKVRAFNTLYEASRGDVIVLLAGDDRIPPRSLELRVAALGQSQEKRSAAFFKIRTFSQEPALDGMLIPRGDKVNPSGASMALSKDLADVIFPIDETLVSEDVWLGIAAEDQAKSVTRCHEVAVEYRIHDGNSNPRNRPFEVMTVSMHARHRAWERLLAQEQFVLSPKCRDRLSLLWRAESFRVDGRILPILRLSELPIVDRLAAVSMTRRWTYSLRSKFYRFLSGWRGV
jgi:glycosyltransferase involved in cell wall biosynthesis